ASTAEPPLPLGSGNDRAQRTRLGKALGRMRDRIFDVGTFMVRIEARGTYEEAQRWRLGTGGEMGAGGRSRRATVALATDRELAMTEWTPEMVEERLVEAAAVLKRLPPATVGGYYNTWPRMKVEFFDPVGRTPRPMRLPPPSATAISRMEATLDWAAWLEP